MLSLCAIYFIQKNNQKSIKNHTPKYIATPNDLCIECYEIIIKYMIKTDNKFIIQKATLILFQH